jgi:hypothetical protein
MKKILLSLVAAATLSFSSFGQAPEGFNYQAVVRDAGNTIVNNQAVGIRMTIQQGAIGGTTVYAETFATTSNAYGLVNLQIGSGTSSDDFSAIDWSAGPFFMETAVDLTGGTNYAVMGTSQLMSVPYALYAKTSGNGQGPQGIQGPAGVDGTNGLDGATGPQGPVGAIGIDGTNGTNGLSAYQEWLSLGNTGTETNFINSLIGPQGAAGATGPQGLQGIQGLSGTNGIDGAIGATGPQGPQGSVGPQGIQGPVGPQGIQGLNGGTGPQGAAGSNGNNGFNGSNGLSAYQVWLSLGNTGTEANFINSLTGPQGIQGATGAQGPQGLAGTNGINGINGANGAQGLQGSTGNQGPQGLTGPQGATGSTGAQGIAGPQGATGSQGATGTISSGAALGNTLFWNGTQWVVNNSNIDNNGSRVGIGTTTPSASAKVEIASTTQGFLPPRMNFTQRNALVFPEVGLTIYNSTSNCLDTWDGQSWFGPCNYEAEKYPVGTVFCDGIVTKVIPVLNPVTGRIWMDRNLGAAQAATSETDFLAYGDLYQWGRSADGHQCRNSTTTSTLSSTDKPSHGNFILSNSSYTPTHDWRSPQNTNLWQGVNGINNPCPSGYRIPTEPELEAERLSWSVNTSVGAFASPLKLPMSGYRNRENGALFIVGISGFCWSSTISGTIARNLYFYSTDTSMIDYYQAGGISVRCLKH